MKTLVSKLALLVVGTSLLASCSMYYPVSANSNNHSTEVHLSQKNFKVVGYVKGSAKATYILGIGGLKKSDLVARAREEMLKDVTLEGTSKALANETIEYKVSNFGVFNSVMITVSAHIIEFTN